MATFINACEYPQTTTLLAAILSHAKQGNRVQFLCEPGIGGAVVQRLRVALSRSRKRNLARGKKIDEFTLHHSIFKYTTLDGKRHDSIVVWTIKTHHHIHREILDDLLERN